MASYLNNYLPLSNEQNFTTTGTITAGAFVGPLTGNVTGSVSGGTITGSTQALTGSGAVDVVSLTTKLNTTGGGTYTLANGTDGQVKIIVLTTDSGTDAVVTPTTKTGFSTITMGDAGDGVTLVYTTTTGWICVGNNGSTLA